jgi:hypothetical protein
MFHILSRGADISRLALKVIINLTINESNNV